ncbi:hypothetical protein [Pseudomonas sp. yb_9]|uniref:hypothetical protein n=1 Tax=Pseudomonas sp. yb_9 TaxID=3367222 RepID=UPI00370C6EF0
MSQLSAELNQSIRWAFSLGKKLLRAAPAHTISVQIIFILSQVLLLLAFFLPLKAIIIVSSGSIPSYFPGIIKVYSHNTVVIWLSASALIFFTSHLIFELFASKVTANGARLLISKAKKIALFDNQDSIAINAYSRFTRGLADLLFFIIAGITLCIFYPLIFFLIAACSVFFGTAISILCGYSSGLQKIVKTHYQEVLNSASGFIFLVTFFGVIADFLYFTPPPAFTALISLLLVRQSLQRLVGFCVKLILLRQQHCQVSALFFHDRPLLVAPSQKAENIHALLSNEQRNLWIPEILKPLFQNEFSIENIKSFQLGSPDIYCYETHCISNGIKQNFIIKLYDTLREYPASQERSLLTEFPGILSPKLLRTGQVRSCTYHILESSNEQKMVGREYYNRSLKFHAALMSLTPPNVFQKKFERSKSYLESRLSSEMLRELTLHAVSDEEQQNVISLLESFDTVKQWLSQSPRQLISFDVTPDTLLIDDNDKLSCVHWGNWHLEPLGANWPISEHQKLAESLEQAAITRAGSSFSFEVAKLASFMYLFERFMNKRDYQSALNLIPEILLCTKTAEAVNGTH